ncbi:MAG: cytochrome c [Gemmatimonadales bacterium]
MSRRLILWVSAALVVAGVSACSRPPVQGLARGEALFDTCLPCHGADGGGNQALGAPAIAGLPQWYVEAQLAAFQAGHRGYDAYDTVGIRMKTMARALDLEGDIPSVAEYVASLSPVRPAGVLTGDAQAGQAAWAVCAACHGADGAGNQSLRAPPLTGQADWYVARQLQKFRAGTRGTGPGDAWGAVMRPNALPLDDAAISNLTAYLQTLR